MSGSKLSEDTNAGRAEGAADQVLGLTVHTMPEPGQALADEARRTRAGRWKLIAMMLVSAAPVIASYFTYYVIRPEGRRNYGELIDPQRPMPDMLTLDLEGRPQRLSDLQGQWLLVSVGSGNCNEACVQQLYFQRQLREGLGKDKERLDRVWLVNDGEPIAPALLQGLKEAAVRRVPANEVAGWLAPAAGQALGDHLYVVDPKGNWMMRFPAHMDISTAAKAKRDLERLLRASSSWDKAGR